MAWRDLHSKRRWNAAGTDLNINVVGLDGKMLRGREDGRLRRASGRTVEEMEGERGERCREEQ